ncbi:NADH-quinone oxidoreductase subunit NuoF [Lignipirellula cremea]|uniref:NADH-quinone oxidoreductase subunit F n=1 Tax=Lignipirellula cremea TaxID=2528010 RepID=A0A518DQV2_9BACT|nr:NADH-quinone oxidoreductase subunit NuoF [Lignipirellula cremea]QDU94209.1 NADH-quinone oxidoreductase subunit F [Lignipirellula cremea]
MEPVLLANIHRSDSHTLSGYESTGGYNAYRKVLAEMSPDDLKDLVKESGLRGRGGAGFPTGLKWTFLPKNHPGPIYFCLNADESEPGTFNNRILMEEDPHQVLEGLALSCYATGAETAYFYIRYEYPLCYKRLTQALEEMYAKGLLGKNILGSGFNLDIYLHRGAAAYICGEETGLIESLEGKRAWPRIKPPFPAIEGAFRKPTVVNNVETAACVPHIVNRGVAWFRSMGVQPDPNNPRDPGSFGPKLYCLSGHIEKPGCYEAPLGITVNELIQEYGGGMLDGRRPKAAIPGGISMGLLTADEFDCPLDFSGPGRYGCLGLGTAAVVVMDETVSMVDYLHNSARFFAHESCGQCTPCREGTSWSLKMLDRIQAGRGRLIDLDLLLEIGDTIGIIPGTTICGLADGAAWPLKNAIRKFRGEFEDFIKQTNPDGYAETSPVPALHEIHGH